MKARTILQKKVEKLSEKLPDITEKQYSWGISHCFTAKELSQKKKISKYCVFSSRVDDMQVCRYLLIKKWSLQITKTEVMRVWVNEQAKITIQARARYMSSYYVDTWNLNSPISIKKDVWGYGNIAYIMPVWISKITSCLPILSRNGLKSSFHGLIPAEVLTELMQNNLYETLWKCKQFSLLAQISYRSKRAFHDEACLQAIKIILRHRYHVTDGNMWLDMVAMLNEAGLDVRNPKHVCPKSLKKGHDYAMQVHKKMEEKKKRQQEKQRLLKEKKFVDAYEKARAKFAKLSIKSGDLDIHVLRTVEEVQKEGEKMHHCVFNMGYYKKLDNLLLSATVGDKRIETIEVDLKKYRLIQSRGVCNENSPYHNEIVSLVNNNMNKIRKFNQQTYK